MTAFFAMLIEAWQEVKAHKLRILLSLIGVTVSVAALTGVLGAGDLAKESLRVMSEKQGGRPATISIAAYGPTGQADAAKTDPVVSRVIDRYGLKTVSRESQGRLPIQLGNYVSDVSVEAVDQSYAQIRLVDVMKPGRWFTENDKTRLAPTVVVNETVWDKLGRPALATNPTLVLGDQTPITAVIVGVQPNQWPGMPPSVFVLQSDATRIGLTTEATTFKIWLDKTYADQLISAIQTDLNAQLPGLNPYVQRADFSGVDDQFRMLQLVVSGIAVMILFLGALGMLTVSLVTVKHRVREIGIRRSFGATSGRVFFGVMLESVVATTVAGLVGVMLAVIVVKLPMVQEKIGYGLIEFPPFPIGVAMLGLAAAIAVGAIAGAIPALIAMRVKVIDAIRY